MAASRQSEMLSLSTTVKTELKPHVFNLDFDHELHTDVCSELVVGIIKYLLYQRGQIPELFEELVSRTKQTSTSEVTSVRNIRANIQVKKENSFIETFQDLFDNLRQVFLLFERTRVRRVAVLLGATPVTPKEVHCIEIPSLVVPTTNRDRPISMRLLFRNLIESARTVTYADLKVTNVTVLLEMNRDARVDWFVPKPSYSTDLPMRGRHFRYVLSWTETQLDRTDSDRRRFKCLPFRVYESPAGTEVDRNRIERGWREEGNEQDFIWFQMPVVIKGLSVRL